MNIQNFEKSLYDKLVKMLENEDNWTTMSSSIVSVDNKIHLYINSLHCTIELLSPEKYQFENTKYAENLYPAVKDLLEKKRIKNLIATFGIDTRLDKLKYLDSIAEAMEEVTPVIEPVIEKVIEKPKKVIYWWTPWWKRV